MSLDKLTRLAAEIENYQSQLVKNQARAQLKALASSLGYSFQYWEKFGAWVLNAKAFFEAVNNTVSETDNETVNSETISLETVNETLKKPDTPLKVAYAVETVNYCKCLQCGVKFESARKTKRFCTNKCKNDFNNAKRK